MFLEDLVETFSWVQYSMENQIQMLMDRTMSAPEWLAMSAYAVLVAVYIQSSHLKWRGLVTGLGYSLLFFSKYYKDRKQYDISKQLQTLGYVSVIIGLTFTHWRDAFAVAGYALAVFNVPEANVLLAATMAFSARETTNIALIAARIALVIYLA